jgi:hypothetical protein
MELPSFVRRVVAWRWTPCVAPVAGSLLIALVTLAVIPDEIGGNTTGAGPLALRSKRDANSGASTDEPSAFDTATGAATAARHAGAAGRTRVPGKVGHGPFAAPEELPSEPDDPMTPRLPSEPPTDGVSMPPGPVSPPPPVPTAGQPETEPGLLPPIEPGLPVVPPAVP